MSSILSNAETETPQERPVRHEQKREASLLGHITIAAAFLCAVVGSTAVYLEQRLSQDMAIFPGVCYGVWIV